MLGGRQVQVRRRGIAHRTQHESRERDDVRQDGESAGRENDESPRPRARRDDEEDRDEDERRRGDVDRVHAHKEARERAREDEAGTAVEEPEGPDEEQHEAEDGEVVLGGDEARREEVARCADRERTGRERREGTAGEKRPHERGRRDADPEPCQEVDHVQGLDAIPGQLGQEGRRPEKETRRRSHRMDESSEEPEARARVVREREDVRVVLPEPAVEGEQPLDEERQGRKADEVPPRRVRTLNIGP